MKLKSTTLSLTHSMSVNPYVFVSCVFIRLFLVLELDETDVQNQENVAAYSGRQGKAFFPLRNKVMYLLLNFRVLDVHKFIISIAHSM